MLLSLLLDSSVNIYKYVYKCTLEIKSDVYTETPCDHVWYSLQNRLFCFVFLLLQPDISQFSNDLMPVLFQFMDVAITTTQQQHKESIGLTKIFYALETFCEQLGADLLPYLPTYMDKLFYALSVTNVR